jgi:hypothetical protein
VASIFYFESLEGFCMRGTRWQSLSSLFLGASAILMAGHPLARAQAEPQSPATELSAGPEVTDHNVRAFRAHVRDLFYQGSYSELESIASGLQRQQPRFKGGAYQLHEFYSLLSSPGELTATDAEWQAHIAKLGVWAKAYPDSPAPRVAMAHSYLNFAWKARGNGFANTVTAEGWTLFRQRVQSARQVLEDAAKVSTHCPEWFRAMQTVALAQGWPRAQVDSLVDAALANEPGYYYFAQAEANYLLPKWYGKPGETEKFAEKVADRTGGDEGNIEYFLVAMSMNCCRKTQAPALDWSRVREGFEALERLYGSTNRQRNAMAFLALRAGDNDTAQQLFTRIGNNWEQSVWRSKVRFDASRTGQKIADTEPLQAEAANGGADQPNK